MCSPKPRPSPGHERGTSRQLSFDLSVYNMHTMCTLPPLATRLRTQDSGCPPVSNPCQLSTLYALRKEDAVFGVCVQELLAPEEGEQEELCP